MATIVSREEEKFKIRIPILVIIGFVLLLTGFVVGTQTVITLGAYDTLGERRLDVR
jgi:hypothetical protein